MLREGKKLLADRYKLAVHVPSAAMAFFSSCRPASMKDPCLSTKTRNKKKGMIIGQIDSKRLTEEVWKKLPRTDPFPELLCWTMETDLQAAVSGSHALADCLCWKGKKRNHGKSRGHGIDEESTAGAPKLLYRKQIENHPVEEVRQPDPRRGAPLPAKGDERYSSGGLPFIGGLARFRNGTVSFPLRGHFGYGRQRWPWPADGVNSRGA